ncbi:tripartite tricarboxylate transporter TctB family protein [Neomoorella humiferrea]|uniref:tripartite tricarboxylate transporter TctB family protein n=1 Tax=Neomoorella humiferrea TaxID=676965 RepID=UPI003D8E325E
MKNPKEERVVALCFLLLAVAWAYLTLQIPATTIPGTPGPRFFPWLLVTALVILSLALFISSGQQQQPAVEKMEWENKKKRKIDWIGIGTLAMFFVYIWTVDLLGFRWGTLIMMPFFLFISFRLRNILEIALITVILSFGLDFIFRVMFKMSLPMGSLF